VVSQSDTATVTDVKPTTVLLSSVPRREDSGTSALAHSPSCTCRFSPAAALVSHRSHVPSPTRCQPVHGPS
jgi:hypothetical protein